ncbi:MAG TPA: Flp family type IVb pilin [Stellaceae bacterium]|jgi:pilus assembly protein Flp/PilA|nr:Flp family type IVb pilin [Stellaceae bacterium]
MQKTRAAYRLRLVAHCFSKNNSGATAIEYALVAMLISLAIAAALPAIAPPINSAFNTVSAKL